MSPSRVEEMDNRQIARVLTETADLMEIAAEDGFRIRSYRNAASAIESYPESVASMACDPERKVTDIPGVGKGIAGVLKELVRARFLRKARSVAGEISCVRVGASKNSRTRPQGHCSDLFSISVSRPSTNWSACAASRSCAIFREWARSWKKKFCAPSRNTGRAPAAIC